MKSKYLFSAVLAVAAALSSCEKHELPFYDGMDAIFFDQQYNGSANESWGSMYDTTVLVHKLYTPVSFLKMEKTDTILAIKVETTGFVRDYLRPFGVHIVADSTTATEGVDFQLLDDSYAILPGNNSTYVHVRLNLTDRMYSEMLQIQLGLDAGDHFTLPFGDKFGDMPKRYISSTVDPVPESRNYDCSVHNIFVDCMLQQPKTWPELPGHLYYLGDFSVKKFALILELVSPRGWTAATFENNMSMDRLGIVNRAFGTYLRQQYDKKEYVLEEDGKTLMWCKNSLVTWANGTTLDDLEKL